MDFGFKVGGGVSMSFKPGGSVTFGFDVGGSYVPPEPDGNNVAKASGSTGYSGYTIVIDGGDDT